MNDQTDIPTFKASANCSKCTVRRRNQPISDRTTMQFLLNDQFALNAKSENENEQKENTKKEQKNTKYDWRRKLKTSKKRTNRFIYNFRLKRKAL